MQYKFGPLVDAGGTTFRLWSPNRKGIELILEDRAPVPLSKGDGGMWSVLVEGVSAGARYKFRIEDKDVPDPASRQQSDDSDGWSVVRARMNGRTRDQALRPWDQTILCEVHIGTVTPDGTFRGLMDRLEHFRDAGYTALEIMPINEFPGRQNWGYDGTLIFAPDSAYGTPEELRALVDRAHELGLCLILDVVYNHFGELHNFLPHYAPEFFDDTIETPWGPAVNFREPMVRQFYYENACWWLEEYDLDGLRFDAVHEMATEARDQFLGELARAARNVKSDAKLLVENTKNNAHWLTRDADDDPVDYSAQWNDDFHHVLNFLVSGEPKHGYENPAKDPIADLEKALVAGFVHDGDVEGESDGRTRGEPAEDLPMEAFVAFVQNHDHIGNRPDGERLAERIDAERLDFAQFVLLLNPQIPLLFMGEEGQLRCGFSFFFDFPEAPARKKEADRYDQMANIFNEKVAPGGLPDPNDPATFEASKLDWDAFGEPRHMGALERFRELTALRRELIWPLTATRGVKAGSARQGNGIIVTWQYEAGHYNMLLNPTGTWIDMSVQLREPTAKTGNIECRGDVVAVGPWSAMVWRS